MSVIRAMCPACCGFEHAVHTCLESGTRLVTKHDKAFPPDDINHPKHYAFSAVEVIDALEAWKLDFRLANVVKYVVRAEHKGRALSDYKKARFYLQRVIDELENK